MSLLRFLAMTAVCLPLLGADAPAEPLTVVNGRAVSRRDLGRSLVPLLGTAPAPSDWRDAVFSQIGNVQMIRTATGAQAGAAMLNVYDGEPGEFFDLRSDPHEFYNRIADPACADTIADLHARLQAWERANRP